MSKTLLDRYRATVDKHAILPADDFLAEQWRCNERTPARMRSKLKAEGYGFAKRNGVWHVTQRPAKQQLVAVPAAPDRPASNNNGAGVVVQGQQLEMPVLAPDWSVVETTASSTHVAAQLALIHQELVTLNGLLAAHFQARNGANQWEIAADSAW
jgi:hypothetical protein